MYKFVVIIGSIEPILVIKLSIYVKLPYANSHILRIMQVTPTILTIDLYIFEGKS